MQQKRRPPSQAHGGRTSRVRWEVDAAISHFPRLTVTKIPSQKNPQRERDYCDLHFRMQYVMVGKPSSGLLHESRSVKQVGSYFSYNRKAENEQVGLAVEPQE